MSAQIFQVISWPMFGMALVIFGFAPRAMLRLIAHAFRRDDPRRHELLAELCAIPRIERPFWVAEQLEVALIEGLAPRIRTRARINKLRRSALALTVLCALIITELVLLDAFHAEAGGPSYLQRACQLTDETSVSVPCLLR